MMLALLAVFSFQFSVSGQSLPATFSPELVFPEESFRVSFPQPVEISGPLGVRMRGNGVSFSGVVVGEEPAFWAAWSDVDAFRYEVPVASVPRWSQWPTSSAVVGGIAFLVSGGRRIAVVPMKSGFGVCFSEKGVERRWAEAVSLDFAVRYGPQHRRPYQPTYVYAGAEAVTILGRPEGVAHLAVRVWSGGIEARLSADYDMDGAVTVLGKRFEVHLRKAETASFSAHF